MTVDDMQNGWRRPKSDPQASDVIAITTVVPSANADTSPLPISAESMGVMPSLEEGTSVDSMVSDVTGENSGVASMLGVGSRLGSTRLRTGVGMRLELVAVGGWERRGVEAAGEERGVD